MNTYSSDHVTKTQIYLNINEVQFVNWEVVMQLIEDNLDEIDNEVQINIKAY